MVYTVLVVISMKEALMLPLYDKNLIEKIVLDFPELSDIFIKYKQELLDSEDVWEKIRNILKQEISSDSIRDEDFQYYFLEILYGLEYNLKRQNKQEEYFSSFKEECVAPYEDIKDSLFRNRVYGKNLTSLREDMLEIISGVEKINKQNYCSTNIKFKWDVQKNEKNGKIKVCFEETNFKALQLLLLFNDRFNLLFSKEGDERTRKIQYEFEILNGFCDSIKEIEKKFSQQDVNIYVWEKLTKMNMAIRLTEFYTITRNQIDNYTTEIPDIIERRDYSEKEFEIDIMELAQIISQSPYGVLMLVWLDDRLKYIENEKKSVLPLELGKIKNDTKWLIKEEQQQWIMALMKIGLYLRDKCFGIDISYRERSKIILKELRLCCPRLMNEMDRNERIEKWYDNLEKSLVYVGVIEDDLTLSEFMVDVITAIGYKPDDENLKLLAFYYYHYSLDTIYGRYNRKILSAEYIRKEFSGKVRRVLQKREEAKQRMLRTALRKIIESKQWKDEWELAKELVKKYWYSLYVLEEEDADDLQEWNGISYANIEDKIDSFSETKRVQTVVEILKQNYNPEIYGEKEVSLLYKPAGNINFSKIWKEEYKKIQKILLYHK